MAASGTPAGAASAAALRSPIHGHRNSLAREGVMTASATAFAGSRNGRYTQPGTSSRRVVTGPSHDRYRVAVSKLNVANGWNCAAGSANFNSVGYHTQVEGTSASFCVYTYTPESMEVDAALTNASYNLNVDIKVPKPSAVAGDSRRGFALVFGYTSPAEYYKVAVNLLNGLWTLERFAAGCDPVCLASVVQPEGLKPTLVYEVLLQVRGASVSLDVNDIPVFTSVRDGMGLRMGGGIGVGTLKTTFTILQWAVTPIGDTRSIPRATTISVSAAAVAAPPPPPPPPPPPLPPPAARAVAAPPLWSDARPSLSPAGSPERPTYRSMIPAPVDPTQAPPVRLVPATSRPVAVREPDSAAPSTEENSLDAQILDTIVRGGSSITFDDITSLDTAKALLNEAVVLPLVAPEFFTGIRHPWRGVLLYGPPGTGKTLLAKAVSGLQGVTFFNCSSADLVSKWRGESEKLIRALFRTARARAPSVIFIDEIDAIMTARKSDDHEASRRMKTSILTEMDGVASGGMVLVLASCNAPWDLDDAFRRRLEKRIYVPLPDGEARTALFRATLKGVPVDADIDYELLSALTVGYSCADIVQICREASLRGVRRLLATMDPRALTAIRERLGERALPPVGMHDLVEALRSTKPSVAQDQIAKFEQWTKEFGSA